MNKKSTSAPLSSLRLTQSKDNDFITQLNKVYKGFFKEPQTMKMLSIKLKIDRANICRHCRILRENNQLSIVKKGLCKITKWRANYYTTNPELIPINPQTKLL